MDPTRWLGAAIASTESKRRTETGKPEETIVRWTPRSQAVETKRDAFEQLRTMSIAYSMLGNTRDNPCHPTRDTLPSS
jgi:hypothetical protein